MTDFTETLEELDAGVLLRKLTKVVQDVALGVVEHEKAGKIQLTLDLKQIGSGAQVSVKHKISYSKPTLRGDIKETDVTVTPMHVAKNGHLSIAPQSQNDLFKETTVTPIKTAN